MFFIAVDRSVRTGGVGGGAPTQGRQGGLGGFPLEPLPCSTPAPRPKSCGDCYNFVYALIPIDYSTVTLFARLRG
jgi:hypothetical protein